MNGVIFTEVLYFFCQPAVCDLRLGHTDTVDFFRTVQIARAVTGRKADFAFLPEWTVPSVSKEKVSCSASSETFALLPVISCRPVTAAFSAALKIFSASFLSVTSLNDFCGPFSLSSMKQSQNGLRMDLNSIRFINLKASGV